MGLHSVRPLCPNILGKYGNIKMIDKLCIVSYFNILNKLQHRFFFNGLYIKQELHYIYLRIFNTNSMLGKKFDSLFIFFFFYFVSENRISNFMHIVSFGDNLHEM